MYSGTHTHMGKYKPLVTHTHCYMPTETALGLGYWLKKERQMAYCHIMIFKILLLSDSCEVLSTFSNGHKGRGYLISALVGAVEPHVYAQCGPTTLNILK